MQIQVETMALQRKYEELKVLINNIQFIQGKLMRVYNSLDSEVKSKRSIGYKLQNINKRIDTIEIRLKKIRNFLNYSYKKYEETERCIKSRVNIENYYNKYSSVKSPFKFNNTVTGEYDKNKLNLLAEGVGCNASKRNGFEAGSAAVGWLGTFLDGGEKGKTAIDTLKFKGKIIQKGNYYIIKGNQDIRKDIIGIPGTRYKIGSKKFNSTNLKYYTPTGSSFAQNANKFIRNLGPSFTDQFKGGLSTIAKDTFVINRSEGLLSNTGKVLGYLGVGLDVANGVSSNIKNGATSNKVVADASIDVAKGLSNMVIATGCAKVGAAIGTAIPIPAVGTAAGAILGFAAGYFGSVLYDNIIDGVTINGKTVCEWASSGVESVLDTIGNAAKKVSDSVTNTITNISNKLDNAKEQVGKAFAGSGKAAFS